MTNQLFANGYALLIGVGVDLPVTVTDATALRGVLVNPHRAAYPPEQVSLLTEASASRQGILAGFDKLIERCNQNPMATAIVYYSGHGGYLQVQDTKEYFLVPYGYEENNRGETAISGLEFTQKIEAIKAKKLIVLLDCCHAGGIPKDSSTRFVKSPVPQELLDALDSGSGRVIVASSHEDEKSYIGDDPYSIFTACLLEALQGKGAKGKDGYARIMEVLSYLFQEVPKRAPLPQHPLVKKADLGDNFPLCYYAGGSKFLPGEMPTSTSPVQRSSLTPEQRRQLERPEEGPVPLSSNFYINRSSVENDCFKEVTMPGALIRIKAPHQMGKTSLLIRIIKHVQQFNYKTVFLKLKKADTEAFDNLESFLKWFCLSIEQQLKSANGVIEFWSKSSLGNKQKCSDYIEKYFLSKCKEPIVLILDDLDEIFKYSAIANNFPSLLRDWREASKIYPIWENLRLVVSYCSEDFPQLSINQSPFNVGLPIELPEFSKEQVKNLAQEQGITVSDDEIVQLTTMVGGHPYLIRVALYEIVSKQLSIADFLRIAPTDEGPYYKHLRRHWLNLKSQIKLAQAMIKVAGSGVNIPVEIGKNDAFKLRNMGLIKFKGNKVLPLFDLYRLYFRDCSWE
ncbi:MAG: hypothetical protein F6K47_18405 [Symploca sp. SIO2E6]|nr:hypothetical protein [Symploca sp. SIO2E6]